MMLYPYTIKEKSSFSDDIQGSTVQHGVCLKIGYIPNEIAI